MKLLYLHRAKVVLLLPLILLSSCLLFHEEENFVTIEQKPDLENIGDVTYSFNGGEFHSLTDTLWLSTEPVSFKFENGNILGYEVKLNGEQIKKRQDSHSFTIEAGDRPAGNYHLEIITFIKSGTGSLADKLDTEYFNVNYEVTLVIGNDVTFVPTLISVVQKDGTVKLTWTKYSHADFQGYEVYKYENSIANIYSKARVLKVDDINVTSLEDSTYVGGIVWYKIKVNRGGKYHESTTTKFYVPYRLNARLTSLGDGRVRLSWDQPPFHRNISSIRISHFNGTIIESLSPENLSYEFQQAIKFGELQDYYVKFTARVSDPGKIPQDQSGYSDRLTIGHRLPPHNSIVYNAAEATYYMIFQSSYYSEYPNALYKVDKDLNIIDSAKHSFFGDIGLFQSADGQRLYAYRGRTVFPIDRNAVTFSQGYEVGQVFYLENTDNLSVSNTNIGVIPGNKDIAIFDFNTKEIVMRINGTPKGVHISPDGQYFIADTQLYNFNGTTFVQVATLPYTGILYARFYDLDAKVVLATENEVIVYDYLDQAEVASYNFSTSIYADPHFNQLSGEYQAGLRLLNVNNGTTKTIDALAAHSYRLEGDYVFTNAGFALKPY